MANDDSGRELRSNSFTCLADAVTATGRPAVSCIYCWVERGRERGESDGTARNCVKAVLLCDGGPAAAIAADAVGAVVTAVDGVVAADAATRRLLTLLS